MGKFYIINAPWAFSTIWSLIKGWLDEATVAKIHILSTDYRAALLEQIPEDSLPSFLGGKCTCAEGCSMSDAGPWKGKKGTSVKAPRVEEKEDVKALEAAVSDLKVADKEEEKVVERAAAAPAVANAETAAIEAK